jgi:RNase P subunit RPR2
MRWLIWYIRSCFCKHSFGYAECLLKTNDAYGRIKEGTVVSATCSKCGYHKSYWKYGLDVR